MLMRSPHALVVTLASASYHLAANETLCDCKCGVLSGEPASSSLLQVGSNNNNVRAASPPGPIAKEGRTSGGAGNTGKLVSSGDHKSEKDTIDMKRTRASNNAFGNGGTVAGDANRRDAQELEDKDSKHTLKSRSHTFVLEREDGHKDLTRAMKNSGASQDITEEELSDFKTPQEQAKSYMEDCRLLPGPGQRALVAFSNDHTWLSKLAEAMEEDQLSAVVHFFPEYRPDKQFKEWNQLAPVKRNCQENTMIWWVSPLDGMVPFPWEKMCICNVLKWAHGFLPKYEESVPCCGGGDAAKDE